MRKLGRLDFCLLTLMKVFSGMSVCSGMNVYSGEKLALLKVFSGINMWYIALSQLPYALSTTTYYVHHATIGACAL